MTKLMLQLYPPCTGTRTLRGGTRQKICRSWDFHSKLHRHQAFDLLLFRWRSVRRCTWRDDQQLATRRTVVLGISLRSVMMLHHCYHLVWSLKSLHRTEHRRELLPWRMHRRIARTEPLFETRQSPLALKCWDDVWEQRMNVIIFMVYKNLFRFWWYGVFFVDVISVFVCMWDILCSVCFINRFIWL